ncbi:MAG: hypothetical protein NZ988_05540 [Thaumarchaeota archaeon]|nr:hypothetical protein [Candidatus Calditenuaceae archaeon]MDW8187486.1 hypothetical protein [Nitrososphaerota archaeon]
MRRLVLVGLIVALAVMLMGTLMAVNLDRGGAGGGPCADRLGFDERNGVTLTLRPAFVGSGVRSIEYTIVNRRSEPVYFGAPYDVQKFTDGKWVTVEWMKDRVWIMILYSLNSGGSMTLTVELPEDIEPGCYRLVKEVMLRDTTESEWKVELVATFVVER